MASTLKAVKFVESDSSGLPVKRKQVHQACITCRRRKKRCTHIESIHNEDAEISEPADSLSRRPEAEVMLQRSPASSRSDITPVHSSRRFVCDTNPEGMFAEAVGFDAGSKSLLGKSAHHTNTVLGEQGTAASSSPKTGGENGVKSPHASNRFVCDTNPEGMFAEATGSGQVRGPARNDEVGVWVSTRHESSSSPHQTPNAVTWRPSIPYDHILLPYVREHCLGCVPPDKDFRHLLKIYQRKIHPIYALVPNSVLDSEENSPAANILLRQVVSLAAATDPSMANRLRLGGETLSFAQFSQTVSGAIRTILATSLIADRTVHIRALCMLSVYFQPTSVEESEVPAQFFAEAVHHAQTLGLHLLRTGDPALETLFCAIWAIDKINAASYGRARLLHERDFAGSIDECASRQVPCFRLFLSVCRWLDRTIDLYRPAASALAQAETAGKPFVDVPVLEPMIVEANALEVAPFLLATVEVFYHAVIILSCRLPRPGAEAAYATVIPPPMANARRSLASERIATNVKKEKLSPVPFVPYAVSLSLSVEYRKMRHSALPMFRARARADFKANCELLRRYRDVFWSARVTYGLGERMLREMERAATTLVQDAPPPRPNDVSSGPTPEAIGTLSTGVGPDLVPRTQAVAKAVAGTGDQREHDAPFKDWAHSDDLPAVDFDFGLDVFGHFDPSFDLTMADNALEGNLDIGLPLNWGEWEPFTAGNG